MFKAPSDWNNLPLNIRSFTSFHMFKNGVSSYFEINCIHVSDDTIPIYIIHYTNHCILYFLYFLYSLFYFCWARIYSWTLYGQLRVVFINVLIFLIVYGLYCIGPLRKRDGSSQGVYPNE